MEAIQILFEAILKWLSDLPTEFLFTIIILMILFLGKRIIGIEKSFELEVKGIREQQVAMQDEYKQSAAELKAAIQKLAQDLGEELTLQKEDLAKNYLLALRTAIMNDSFPKSYRLEKYDEYHKLGGNSFIDDHVQNVILKESGND